MITQKAQRTDGTWDVFIGLDVVANFENETDADQCLSVMQRAWLEGYDECLAMEDQP